jgi:hypothetical protein
VEGGSCAKAKYEDLAVAARILKIDLAAGKGMQLAVPEG